MVPFGIAKDGLRTVLDAIQGRGGPIQAVQVNFSVRDSKGRRIEEF
jgi:hypothetical protein